MVSEPGTRRVRGVDTRRCVNKDAWPQREWMGGEPSTSEEAKPQRGVDTRRCVNKDTWPQREWIGGGGPTSIGEGNECQRECWALRGADSEIPHWLEMRTKHSL